MPSTQTIQDDIHLLHETGKTKDLLTFQEVSDSLIIKWKDQNELRVLALEVCNNLSSWNNEPAENRVNLLKQYSSLGLFQMNIPSIEFDFQFLNHLTYANTILDWRYDNDADDQRNALTKKWLEAWQSIENDRELDFDFENVPELNVAPPDEAQLFSGVDPKAIKDPELRKEYELTIEKNRIKAENYSYQITLLDLHKTYRSELISYFQQNYLKREIKEVENLLNQYSIEEKMSQEILEVITL